MGILSKKIFIKALIEKYRQTIDILHAVLNSVHNGICAIDRRGKLILFNAGAEKITGISSQEAVGRPIEEIIPNTKMREVLDTVSSTAPPLRLL